MKRCSHFINNEQSLQPPYAIAIMPISSSERATIIRFRRVTERKLYWKLESDKQHAGDHNGILAN